MKIKKTLLIACFVTTARLFAPALIGVENKSGFPAYIKANFPGTAWGNSEHKNSAGAPIAPGAVLEIPPKTNLYNLLFYLPPAWKNDPHQYVEVRVASSPEQKFYLQYTEADSSSPKIPRITRQIGGTTSDTTQGEKNMILVIENAPAVTSAQLAKQAVQESGEALADQLKGMKDLIPRFP